MLIVTLAGMWLAATIMLRATTRYILRPDRLLIRRSGFVWMEIFFDDVEEIEEQAVFFSKPFQIRLYQFVFRRMLRITKRKGFFRHVLLNPRDPAEIVRAVAAFKHGRSVTQET
jgi:hypothetical protein